MRMRHLDTKSSPHLSEYLLSQSQFPAQLAGMQWFQENARVGVLKQSHGVRTKWNDVNLSVEVPASARTKELAVLSPPGERGAQRPAAEAPAGPAGGHPAGNGAHRAPPAWGPSTGQVTVLEGLECCRKDPGPPPAPELSCPEASNSATLWTAARQALCAGFSRQEHWSELPFPLPGDLPDPGVGPMSLEAPASAGGFFTTEPPGKHPLGSG